MATLESRIDELYKGRPDEFVAARATLAKALSGDDAKRVKALTKPTLVPWSVNQVYWHARDIYQRLTKAGEKLRQAQVAALNGRAADVRGTTVAQRQAIADAVKAAAGFAAAIGAHPDPDPLARMFEALSVQEALPESPGRFTKPLQPQGFEALAGIAIKPSSHARPAAPARLESKSNLLKMPTRAESAHEARRREREEVLERERQAAIKKAEATVARAKAEEARAREEWHQSRQKLEEAESALHDARAGTSHRPTPARP